LSAASETIGTSPAAYSSDGQALYRRRWPEGGLAHERRWLSPEAPCNYVSPGSTGCRSAAATQYRKATAELTIRKSLAFRYSRGPGSADLEGSDRCSDLVSRRNGTQVTTAQVVRRNYVSNYPVAACSALRQVAQHVNWIALCQLGILWRN
jgi:hypothetical protein